MHFHRRRFLGSSVIALGATLLDALATPIWKWNRSAILEAKSFPNVSATSPVTFVDVAREAGLTTPNVWGGEDHKRFIIEAKGSGLAFFDYDNDGWLDIYLTNGTRWAQVACRHRSDFSFVQEQPRRNVHRCHGKIRTRSHRLADRRVCGRLRQRWLGRSVLLLLGTQHPVPQ